MGGKHSVAALRLLRRHRNFFVRHWSLFCPHAGDLLAGEVELDSINAVFDKLAHGAPYFLGPRDDDAEIEALMRNVRGRRIAKTANRRNLRTGSEITRA